MSRHDPGERTPDKLMPRGTIPFTAGGDVDRSARTSGNMLAREYLRMYHVSRSLVADSTRLDADGNLVSHRVMREAVERTWVEPVVDGRVTVSVVLSGVAWWATEGEIRETPQPLESLRVGTSGWHLLRPPTKRHHPDAWDYSEEMAGMVDVFRASDMFPEFPGEHATGAVPERLIWWRQSSGELNLW